MRKKFLAMLLAAVLAVGLLSGTAWAADPTSGTCGDNAAWNFVESTGVLTISGTGAMDDYRRSSLPWDSYCSNITSVIIQDGVTTIGKCAFYLCTKLASVTIPDSVISIGEDAFTGCKNLTSVALPSSVTSIGSGAFLDCEKLTNVTIPSSVTSIGSGAFYKTPWLASLGEFATVNGILLEYSGSGSSVAIPSTVTTIGENAFEFCTDLTSVTIPNSVTTIDNSAFYGCYNLTSVSIPNSVTSIGNAAFMSCENLTSVALGNGLKTIGENAFRFCTGLTSITIPNGVTTIKNYAFFGCDNLKSVTIPGSVTDIASGAFTTHINSPEYVAIPDLTIYGEAGSYAESYANDYAFPFVVIRTTAPTFTDVPDWAAVEVSWGAGKGIVQGIGEGLLGAFRDCTHIEILTFLWRAAGSPPAAPAPVASGYDIEDFQSAINWAYEEGIINGSFVPSDPCNRASAVKYIWQALGSESAPASGFPDVDVNADYAPAVNWALDKGVTTGTGDGSVFSPDNICTRAEIITFLYRAYTD